MHYTIFCLLRHKPHRSVNYESIGIISGGATRGRARSNDPAGRSTAVAPALAPPCLALHIALLQSSTFFVEKMHPGDVAGGFSDLEMTCLLYCTDVATGHNPDFLLK